MLGDHRDGNLRVVHRRQGDKQGMVAHFEVDRILVVFFLLLDREHLCGSGFAGDLVIDIFCDQFRGAARAVNHVGHGAEDVVDIGRFQRNVGDDTQFGRRGVIRRDDFLHQVRVDHFAVIGQRRGGARQLQRGHLGVALAYPGNHRLAGKPDLVAVTPLPFLGRHQAVDLSD